MKILIILFLVFTALQAKELEKIKKDLEKAGARTISWAKRCKKEYEKQLKKRKNLQLIFINE